MKSLHGGHNPFVRLTRGAAGPTTVVLLLALTSSAQGAEREDSSLRHLGTASCASVSCHGESGDFRRTGGEFGLWKQNDPHARAQSLLYEVRSQKMGARLGIAAVQRSERCTGCHATEGEPVPEIDRPTLLSFGVGCEACHGPAERWIDPHKRLEWSDPNVWSDERKAALGFKMTKDPTVRAETCVRCHIGEPGRDMNHDLIAAGHPRLSFELSSYHARLPKHWGRSEDLRRNSPVLEARLWLVGQVASLDQSLALLDRRAATTSNPWPEFSEYVCANCHHNLSASAPPSNVESALPGFADVAESASIYTWNTWHRTFVELLSDPLDRDRAAKLNSDLGALRTEMEKPLPSRQEIRELIKPVRATLQDLKYEAGRAQIDLADVRQLSLRLAGSGRTLVTRDWDASTQLFFGLSAMHYAEAEATGQFGSFRTPRTARMAESLNLMRSQLDRSSRTNPRQLGPSQFRRQRSVDLTKTVGRIEELLSQPD